MNTDLYDADSIVGVLLSDDRINNYKNPSKVLSKRLIKLITSTFNTENEFKPSILKSSKLIRRHTDFHYSAFELSSDNVHISGVDIVDTLVDPATKILWDEVTTKLNYHLPDLRFPSYTEEFTRYGIHVRPKVISRPLVRNIILNKVSIITTRNLIPFNISYGIFENLIINNVDIKTNSSITMSLYGVVSGSLGISSNTMSTIVLKPVKLHRDLNIYITGMQDRPFRPLKTKVSNINIVDIRGEPIKNAVCYKNFNFKMYKDILNEAGRSSLKVIKDAAYQASGE